MAARSTIYMNWIYFQLKYMNGLRNAFPAEPSENIPSVAEPQPETTVVVNTEVAMALDAIFKIRSNIMNAVIKRGF